MPRRPQTASARVNTDRQPPTLPEVEALHAEATSRRKFSSLHLHITQPLMGGSAEAQFYYVYKF